MLLFRSRGRVINILFNLKKKNCLGNKKSLSLMSSIVALCFKKKKESVQAQFRYRSPFKIMCNFKKKNSLGNKKSVCLISSIVTLCFKKKKVSVQAPFRHRYRFKSIGYVPVSDKNQTIPIPTYNSPVPSDQDR